jgi:hypothetical protein
MATFCTIPSATILSNHEKFVGPNYIIIRWDLLVRCCAGL